ncbi:MAG: hypothetical protein AABY06_03660 [Nanoarchaeota archaeon]
MKKRGTPVCTRNYIKNYGNKFVSRKRSQAFLITAIIFIAIVSTLITIKNYSKKTEFSSFPYIAEEIQIESEKVMDYSLVSGNDVINDFTKDVSDYTKKEDIDIYFITDDGCSNCNSLTTNENNITATINGINYDFPKYSQGKHFYFIMIKERGGEKYVYTNA